MFSFVKCLNLVKCFCFLDKILLNFKFNYVGIDKSFNLKVDSSTIWKFIIPPKKMSQERHLLECSEIHVGQILIHGERAKSLKEFSTCPSISPGSISASS